MSWRLLLRVRLRLRRLVAGWRPVGDVKNAVGIAHFHASIPSDFVGLTCWIDWDASKHAHPHKIVKVVRGDTHLFPIEIRHFFQFRYLFVHPQGTEMVDGVPPD